MQPNPNHTEQVVEFLTSGIEFTDEQKVRLAEVLGPHLQAIYDRIGAGVLARVGAPKLAAVAVEMSQAFETSIANLTDGVADQPRPTLTLLTGGKAGD